MMCLVPGLWLQRTVAVATCFLHNSRCKIGSSGWVVTWCRVGVCICIHLYVWLSARPCGVVLVVGAAGHAQLGDVLVLGTCARGGAALL